jgi:predicted Zn finger-like uncharacterized protein
MKFRCDQCNAQYMIAAEKVGKKGVKVRCKKCGFIIIIRPEIENETLTEPQQQKSALPAKADVSVLPQPAMTDLQLSLDDDRNQATIHDEAAVDQELGRVANKLLDNEGDQDDSDDLDRQSTRLFSVEEIRRVQAEKVQASLEAIERREIATIDRPNPAALSDEPDAAQQIDKTNWPADAEPERLEWYVAIDDQQIGPVSLGELGKRRERGELGPETLVWKAGLDDWKPVMELEELRALMTVSSDTSNRETQREETATDQQEPIQIGWVADDAKSPDTVDFSSRETAYDGTGVQTSASESVGMDIDWKPQAISVLRSLANEELAALRPVDPQPEEEMPSTTGETSTEKDAGASVAGIGAPDGSIIDQIKAEDAAALRLAEKKHTDEKRDAEQTAAPSTRTVHEGDVRGDKLPARLSQSAERLAYPPEPYPSHRASIPNWVVTMLAASGLVIVILLGFIAYRLLEGQRNPPAPITTHQSSSAPTATQPGPAAPNTGGPGPSEPPSPPAGPNAAMVAQPTPQPSTNLGTTSARTQIIDPNASPKEITIPTRRPRSPAPLKPARAAEDSPKVAERGKVREEPLPSPTSAAARNKEDVLDFGGDETKAVVKVDGNKPKELPPLSNVDVMDVMRKHMSEFQACSQKDSSIKGKMMVSFVIVNDGTVSKVSTLSDEFKGSGFSECISSLIKSIRFPKSSGEPKTVPFPFTVK